MIRRPESFYRKSLHVLILAVTLVAVILASHQQQAYASDDENDNDNDGKNPLSDALRGFAEGIDQSDAGTAAGREAARQDFYSGTDNSQCPHDPGAWCFGYNTGYSTVMNQLRSAHR